MTEKYVKLSDVKDILEKAGLVKQYYDDGYESITGYITDNVNDGLAELPIYEFEDEEEEHTDGKTKLKPCPFCGATEITTSNHSGLFIEEGVCEYRVLCTVCGANTGWENRTREEAIEAWNRRANDEG